MLQLDVIAYFFLGGAAFLIYHGIRRRDIQTVRDAKEIVKLHKKFQKDMEGVEVGQPQMDVPPPPPTAVNMPAGPSPEERREKAAAYLATLTAQRQSKGTDVAMQVKDYDFGRLNPADIHDDQDWADVR